MHVHRPAAQLCTAADTNPRYRILSAGYQGSQHFVPSRLTMTSFAPMRFVSFVFSVEVVNTVTSAPSAVANFTAGRLAPSVIYKRHDRHLA